VTIGSEVSGGVRDVFIHDIEFDHADCGIRMKSSKERGGFIEGIDVENLRMTKCPVSFFLDHGLAQ
jgi:polygalacturonase